jgi:hypothetical protein
MERPRYARGSLRRRPRGARIEPPQQQRLDHDRTVFATSPKRCARRPEGVDLAPRAWRADLQKEEEIMADRHDGSTLATTDHDTIRRWTEERDGTPAHVTGVGSQDDSGIIRIDFPGYSGDGSLEEISWEEWFDKFDHADLALLYREHEEDGEPSNFNKLVDRETVEERL